MPAHIPQLGQIGQFSCSRAHTRFGRNADIGTGAFEPVWDTGGTYSGWLTTADEVRIKSGGNAADTAAGAGAREVTVVGIDENWAVTSEAIATNGASVSAKTTAKFLRVYRAYVSASGTYGAANTGDIVIETEGAVAVAEIIAAMGETQMAMHTTGATERAYILGVSLYTGVDGDGSDSMTVRMWKRENANDATAPVSAPRLVRQWDVVQGPFSEAFLAPVLMPTYTDVWFTAQANTTIAPLGVAFTYVEGDR